MDIINIFRTFHPNAEEYTFSSEHGTFSRIDHILDHKTNFSKFKKIDIVSSIFSNHNAMRLDINYKEKSLRAQTHVYEIIIIQVNIFVNYAVFFFKWKK